METTVPPNTLHLKPVVKGPPPYRGAWHIEKRPFRFLEPIFGECGSKSQVYFRNQSVTSREMTSLGQGHDYSKETLRHTTNMSFRSPHLYLHTYEHRGREKSGHFLSSLQALKVPQPTPVFLNSYTTWSGNLYLCNPLQHWGLCAGLPASKDTQTFLCCYTTFSMASLLVGTKLINFSKPISSSVKQN